MGRNSIAKARRRSCGPFHTRRPKSKRRIRSRRSVHSQHFTVKLFLERLAAAKLAATTTMPESPSSSITKQEEVEEARHDQPQTLIPLIKSFSNVM
ncbi:unnamed protein product [Eruca vesicaria subsp. sativa]|uniref:Uncharacterized protein n=1 Tax=Eruca vesicaria subsp. sativa TaxID=29727 RepID=A0ABC8LWI8_ERUVS|nr:unnamed protein product [Eruca vesicaria subsp. sativa]